MNNVKGQWQRLADRIDAMSLRERALIFLAIALALLVSLNLMLIDPMLTKNKNLQRQIQQEEQVAQAMEQQIQTLAKSFTADPDAALRQRLAELHLQSKDQITTLEGIQSGLVPPERMPALLQDLLRRARSLTLVSMRTLPVQATGVGNVAATDDSASPAGDPVQGNTVYQHGVEITVEGSYLDLLGYLNKVESLPWHMFWGRAVVNGDDYPKVSLTLTVYTLSLDQAWLKL